MKIFQAKKGQFVYYKNELHKVYLIKIKVNFKKAFYLYRLKDMQQVVTPAESLQTYHPEHKDTFIFCGKRFMIDKNKVPVSDDYILIVKPTPDYLDHYSLNAIEEVELVEGDDVVTTQSNGVKSKEYAVMVPDKSKDGRAIDYFEYRLVPDHQLQTDESPRVAQNIKQQHYPVIGDIYYDTKKDMDVMITATNNSEVFFGHGHHLRIMDLLDGDRYTLTNTY